MQVESTPPRTFALPVRNLYTFLYSVENQYELHPIESVVTIMRKHKANMDSLFTWYYLGESPSSLKNEFEYLGLIWEEEKLSPNVVARISTTRRASYKAMGYGLNINGVVRKRPLESPDHCGTPNGK